MELNVPNTVTWFRIILIPIFFMVFFIPDPAGSYAAATVFSLAGISDWLDGYLARRLKQTTKFGAFFDPVADKLVVVGALVLLTAKYPIIAIPAAIIVGREITVSALREWMAELGARASVAVSSLGKIKTTIQITAIIVLLALGNFEHILLSYSGIVLLYVAAILTIWSMVLYLRAAWPQLRSKS